ncbi:DUF4240 domain-containing protein [Actinophytocola sp. KF-1]
MDLDTWWGVIERARTAVGERAGDRDFPDDPLPDAVTEELATFTPAELVDWYVRYVQLTDSAYRYPLWGAAYLIEGGCGDDGFMDFRDGLMLQGREVFTRAVADPDSLADLPVVRRMAEDKGWLGFESLSYLVGDAYERVRGDAEPLDDALAKAIDNRTRPDKATGHSWDGEDDEANRRHLPRLAELFR